MSPMTAGLVAIKVSNALRAESIPARVRAAHITGQEWRVEVVTNFHGLGDAVTQINSHAELFGALDAIRAASREPGPEPVQAAPEPTAPAMETGYRPAVEPAQPATPAAPETATGRDKKGTGKK